MTVAHHPPVGSRRHRSNAFKFTAARVIGASIALAAGVLATSTDAAEPGPKLKAIPDRLLVLTFDDASRSHFTVVRPILKEYGFSATFFVTEGFDFTSNKQDYLSWNQIQTLHEDGFEIGNHTRDHLGITDKTVERLPEQLAGIDRQCEAHGIPRPVSFAWPGNAFTNRAFETLATHGIRFARRGGAPEYPYDQGQGFAYQPGLDHPLLIPSAGDARPAWTPEDFVRAAEQARDGRIAVLQFHGVPDTAHDWVSMNPQNFRACMKYLVVHQFKVIALRDLGQYVDHTVVPDDYLDIVESRKIRLQAETAAP